MGKTLKSGNLLVVSWISGYQSALLHKLYHYSLILVTDILFTTKRKYILVKYQFVCACWISSFQKNVKRNDEEEVRPWISYMIWRFALGSFSNLKSDDRIEQLLIRCQRFSKRQRFSIIFSLYYLLCYLAIIFTY